MTGDTPLFTGTPSALNAPVASGRFPLILLSHGAGLGGNAQAVSWLAAPLAENGFIVAAPTHPQNTGPQRSAAVTMRLWLRPADLSETLNRINEDVLIREHLRPGSVGVLGLSMGGSTAISIAGGRIQPKLLADYCDDELHNISLCEWIRLSGVNLHKMVPENSGNDYRDKRIRFAMAIDPAPADIFDLKSLSKISIPVHIINLGRAEKIPSTARAEKLAKLIPAGRYTLISDASHFSMFGECRPGAETVLKAAHIDDPVCTDGGERSRHDIHQQLIRMVNSFFKHELTPDE
ncbi:hypothetical protein SJI19_04330 [Acerihabitans sp. TG2]|uniref:alpha/beta hydrolase family protein n=1 Tax=Acerihabitans sp. TG2 TaxID=3096008 RepID=UPI002B23A287|nr:hypothetical protein [Acerihabitans sp. TG2]MEA9389788.1 hypothetical protein [Acerihabitans sp. TG2]